MKKLLILVSAITVVYSKNCNFDCSGVYKSDLCASNGKTYASDCDLRKDACQQSVAITKVHDGNCKSGSNRCSATNPCVALPIPVCGSNGKNYMSECLLREEACKTNTAISIIKHSDPEEMCPWCNVFCPKDKSPICGSDGETYENICKMRESACKQKKAIIKIYDGKC